MADRGTTRGRSVSGDLAAGAHFHLFTYGSLKSTAAGSRSVLRGCERVASGAIRGMLYDVGEYPAALLDGGDGGDVVRGEVWRCPADLLPELDRYEGVAEGLFRRAAVEVDGVACWVYVAGPRLGERLVPEARLEAGDWSA